MLGLLPHCGQWGGEMTLTEQHVREVFLAANACREAGLQRHRSRYGRMVRLIGANVAVALRMAYIAWPPQLHRLVDSAIANKQCIAPAVDQVPPAPRDCRARRPDTLQEQHGQQPKQPSLYVREQMHRMPGLGAHSGLYTDAHVLSPRRQSQPGCGDEIDCGFEVHEVRARAGGSSGESPAPPRQQAEHPPQEVLIQRGATRTPQGAPQTIHVDEVACSVVAHQVVERTVRD